MKMPLWGRYKLSLIIHLFQHMMFLVLGTSWELRKHLENE